MCVIAYCGSVRPTEEQVEKMFLANNSGAGIAYRTKKIDEKTKEEKLVVAWNKGLELDDIQEKAATAPLPYVLHFRIPSTGGDSRLLCHPFPISAGSELFMEGTYDGYVLFHNGTWNRWKDFLFEHYLRSNRKMPKGPWSDTRAMAVIAASAGLPILELINEKYVAFGPTDEEIGPEGPHWYKVEVPKTEVEYADGKVGPGTIWTSNKYWECHSTGRVSGFLGPGCGRNDGDDYSYLQVCVVANCKEPREENEIYCAKHAISKKPRRAGGLSEAHENFRPGPVAIPAGPRQEESTQQSQETLREGRGEGSQVGGHKSDLDEAIELLKWTRSLNPNEYKASIN